MNTEEAFLHAKYRRTVEGGVVCYTERTERGRQQVKLALMKRFPRLYTNEALRSAGLTVRGTRRKVV